MKTPQDWLDTYYPTPADSPEALAAPAAHSLRKWQGLVPEVLEEHGLYVYETSVLDKTKSYSGLVPFDEKILSIGADSCALCEVYLRVKGGGCDKCPLTSIRGGYTCDMPIPEEVESGRKAPYGMFSYYNDPHPMINLLEKAVELEESMLVWDDEDEQLLKEADQDWAEGKIDELP